jgi:GNAT superfamily N-acetyltransferase
MARRMARLTLDNLSDLPLGCASCVFWELDAVRRQWADEAGETACEKEAWVSRALLEWGSCGRVAYVDGEPAGYVLFAPASYFPGADAFATAPVSEDAVLRATAMVFPAYAGAGLGRVLMQTVVKDLVKRGGIRALEAIGDTQGPGRRDWARGAADTYGGCVLPADYLLRVGFKTQRAHPRYPRMRLELRTALTWRDEVESALERLLGVVRPVRQPATEPSPRVVGGRVVGAGLSEAQAARSGRPPDTSARDRSRPVRGAGAVPRGAR